MSLVITLLCLGLGKECWHRLSELQSPEMLFVGQWLLSMDCLAQAYRLQLLALHVPIILDTNHHLILILTITSSVLATFAIDLAHIATGLSTRTRVTGGCTHAPRSTTS